MKVTQIRSFSVQDEGGRAYMIVRVDTDAGHHGLGEVGIRNWGRAIGAAIEHLSELVIGADPWETERLWQEMFRSGFFPADKVYTCAISAIDIALWDIKGKSVNMPTYKLMGGPVRNKVVSYPHTQGKTTKELIANSLAAVEAGWKFVRWGQPETGAAGFEAPGISTLEPIESMKIAIDQMGQLREAVGPDIQMTFDVHTRLDTAHVVQMCKEMEQFKPFFIEDPIRSENQGSYRNLRRQINLPIAAGEQWASKWPFREVIEEDLIDYARIDLCIVGGLTEALKITHWAETHYIDIVPHNPLGPVSAAACVALCMASSNVGVQEMPRRPGSYATDLFPQQIEWDDGYSWCPDAPGLGVEFDIDAAESAAVDPHGWPPRLRRNDGAITNW
ncbi:MAG: mandelate racemase/muconate lactonizing enzyme family protein [Chloroflexi bacterium]|jgi:galactonate dehydratase|nr:mandelate racemase/muconate lactonizing enzyme family protein [Chloroflexota bacterium]MBT4341628.1 mandelate racemase/muconate lactonizing enzyme family protein [Chloroflexota bacterium]MBT4944265.1 mandelate racemase/muconate lactonizing enzyme family protein [Chloroflexota bacterium]MBT5476699.1 mandelate racemase/muconate lactonizing enzyme family protein [Chloroflexota bacterium]MBT7078406.1 mandelate racemase/muconate lactonizing enzyme family protein [Chloroflexota bacterium]